MSGEFAVIGLGQFGRAVALSLVREGAAVLAIDQLEERAQLVESEVDAVACAACGAVTLCVDRGKLIELAGDPEGPAT